MAFSSFAIPYRLPQLGQLFDKSDVQFNACKSDISNVPGFILTAIKIRAIHIELTIYNFADLFVGCIELGVKKCAPIIDPAFNVLLNIFRKEKGSKDSIYPGDARFAYDIMCIKIRTFVMATSFYGLLAPRDYYDYWRPLAARHFMPLSFPQIYYKEGSGPIYDYKVEYQLEKEQRTS